METGLSEARWSERMRPGPQRAGFAWARKRDTFSQEMGRKEKLGGETGSLCGSERREGEPEPLELKRAGVEGPEVLQDRAVLYADGSWRQRSAWDFQLSPGSREARPLSPLNRSANHSY